MTTASVPAPAQESFTPNKLSGREQERLAQLELVIADGMPTFIGVGAALAEINESKLYRATHPNFGAYCEEKWGWSRQRAYQYIEASKVVERIGAAPDTERQTRTLAELPKEAQKEAWEDAKERARQDGKEKPTAKHVEAAVRARQPEPQDNPEPDITDELAQAVKENEALRAEIESLTQTDKDKEIRRLHAQVAQHSANYQRLMAEKHEAEAKAVWATGVLSKLCKLLKVDKPKDLVEAVKLLVA